MRRIFLIFAAVLCLCSSMASAAESEPDWQDIDEESMMEKVCDAAMKCYDEQQKHKLNN